MPLQNRVTPFGEFIMTPARGMLMGNRGGRLHDSGRRLGGRHWASKQWICCRLDFNGRHRAVWGNGYTELFFVDEVTAFAAGHRPCFECRRRDAELFAVLFAGVDPNSARSRASGNPGSQSPAYRPVFLGSRLRGDERISEQRIRAPSMDKILHAERLAGKARRLHRRAIDALPDGAMVVRAGEALAVRGDELLRWTPAGYTQAVPRPRGAEFNVLTPPSILAVLANGYRPLWHDSAG